MTFLSPAEARRQLQDVGRDMVANQLAWGNAGNISARTGEHRCVITASGIRMGELTDDDLIEVDWTGETPSFARKPSKELPMHSAIYQERPDVQVILHSSPFHATVLACAGDDIPAGLFVEAMYYLERVARVPYRHPGSQALADVVREKANQANVFLLENHGVIVCDASAREAFVGLQVLEYASRMLLMARAAGIPLAPLPAEVVDDFLAHSGYRKRRQWQA